MEGAPLGVGWPHLRNRGSERPGQSGYCRLTAVTCSQNTGCQFPTSPDPMWTGRTLQDPLFSAGSFCLAFTDPCCQLLPGH